MESRRGSRRTKVVVKVELGVVIVALVVMLTMVTMGK